MEGGREGLGHSHGYLVNDSNPTSSVQVVALFSKELATFSSPFA